MPIDSQYEFNKKKPNFSTFQQIKRVFLKFKKTPKKKEKKSNSCSGKIHFKVKVPVPYFV